jgi:hypothetical protein
MRVARRALHSEDARGCNGSPAAVLVRVAGHRRASLRSRPSPHGSRYQVLLRNRWTAAEFVHRRRKCLVEVRSAEFAAALRGALSRLRAKGTSLPNIAIRQSGARSAPFFLFLDRPR